MPSQSNEHVNYTLILGSSQDQRDNATIRRLDKHVSILKSSQREMKIKNSTESRTWIKEKGEKKKIHVVGHCERSSAGRWRSYVRADENAHASKRWETPRIWSDEDHTVSITLFPLVPSLLPVCLARQSYSVASRVNIDPRARFLPQLLVKSSSL